MTGVHHVQRARNVTARPRRMPQLPPNLVAAHQRLYSGDYDPFAHRCTCGAPKSDHSGAKNTGRCTATGCTRYRADVVDEMIDKALAASGSSWLADIAEWQERAYPRPKPTPGGWDIGPSSYDECPKAIQLRNLPPEGFVPEPDLSAASVAGTMFHDAHRRARSAKYPWRMFEQPITIPGMDRPGRFDEYDPLLGEVVDLKTCGTWAWDRLGDRGADPKHWGQLSIYAQALRSAGYPVRKLRLIYVNRETLTDEQFTAPYNEAVGRAALGELRAMSVALDAGEELPRDPRRSGPSSDPLCARCPFRRPCWNMDAAEAAGRSPESYTILGPDPAWKDIEWAAARVAHFAAQKKAAEDQYDAAKVLLQGIAPGTYGEYVVTERTRAMPNWKAWAERVRAARDRYAATPEDLRGADFADWVAHIEVPKRVDSWPQVKRVRAADRTPGASTHRAPEPADHRTPGQKVTT